MHACVHMYVHTHADNADEIESQYTAAFRDANFSDTYVAAAEPRLVRMLIMMG